MIKGTQMASPVLSGSSDDRESRRLEIEEDKWRSTEGPGRR